MPIDVVLLAIASAFLVASGHVLARFGLATLSPLQGAGVSLPTTALAFCALAPVFMDTSRWTWPALLIFAATGIVFPAAVTLMNFESNRRIGPGLTSALTNLTPIFAVLGGIAVLGEVPRPSQGVALGIIVAGIALLLWRPERLLGSIPILALAIPLIAGIVRGLTQPGIKLGQLSWPDPYSATTIGYIVSALSVLAVKAVREGEIRLPPRDRGALWFCAAGLSNGLSLLTLYAALARGPIAIVSPLVACYPLFAVGLSRLFLGARIDLRGLIGIAITIGGIAMLLAA